MIDNAAPHPRGKHRYTSVVQGMELANEFARSRLSTAEFARQRGVSAQMVRYWSARARCLATSAQSELVQIAEVTSEGAIEPAPTTPALPSPAATPLPKPVPIAPAAASAPTIELRLPNGVCIGIGAGFSPQVLSQVIACVGGRPC